MDLSAAAIVVNLQHLQGGALWRLPCDMLDSALLTVATRQEDHSVTLCSSTSCYTGKVCNSASGAMLLAALCHLTQLPVPCAGTTGSDGYVRGAKGHASDSKVPAHAPGAPGGQRGPRDGGGGSASDGQVS